MRADANNLLERLGRQDFAYREFADRFAELEPWPLFESLLKDRRLFASASAEAAPVPLARMAEPPAETRRADNRPAQTRAPDMRQDDLRHGEYRPDNARPDDAMAAAPAPAGHSLFHRYDSAPPAPPPVQTRETQDIRELLQALSQAGGGDRADNGGNV